MLAGACAAGVALFGELPPAGAVDCAQTPTAMASANPARTAVLDTMRSTATMTKPPPPSNCATHGPASLYHLDASMFHFGNKGKAAFFQMGASTLTPRAKPILGLVEGFLPISRTCTNPALSGVLLSPRRMIPILCLPSPEFASGYRRTPGSTSLVPRLPWTLVRTLCSCLTPFQYSEENSREALCG